MKLSATQWCLLAIVMIGLGVSAIGAANREVPMSRAELTNVVTQLPKPSGKQKDWRVITYERDQVRNFQGQSFNLVVKSELQNLGDGFVLRIDNWHPKNSGGALVLEERSLLWANLFTLVYRYREPVPGYHLIFENQGWVKHKMIALTATFANMDPLALDWALSAKMSREEEKYSDSKKSINDRSLQCSRSNVSETQANPLVNCQISNNAGDKTESTSRYVKELGIYIRQASDFQTPEGMVEKGQATRNILVDGVELKL